MLRQRAGNGIGGVPGFNLIYGIAAVANPHVFTANAHFVFGNLRAWGWITLIIGVVRLLAAAGVMAGNQPARWFGVAVLGLNAIDQMVFLPAYPFWSLAIIAVETPTVRSEKDLHPERTRGVSRPCAQNPAGWRTTTVWIRPGGE